jgi:hypothetical protein
MRLTSDFPTPHGMDRHATPLPAPRWLADAPVPPRPVPSHGPDHLSHRRTRRGLGLQTRRHLVRTYPDHDSARAAAVAVAREQKVPDENTLIEYADASGEWVTERADGRDRPEVDVQG